ncbi:low-affinity phosphate transporter [Boothiomyces sp. JEL0838]|nr:low-affinity phosphate transporter [Boothiomyces sp. JEL0838]
MKFSHSLQLNSAPEWIQYYIAYSRLKKTIYVLEKAVLGLGSIPHTETDLEVLISNPELDQDTGDELTNNSVANISNHVDEAQPLLENAKLSVEEANRFFCTVLDRELAKIVDFYTKKEGNFAFDLRLNLSKLGELLLELHEMTNEITRQERQEESYLHNLWQQESRILESSSATKQTPRAIDSFDHENEIAIDTPRQAVPRPGFLPYLIWSSGSLKHMRQQFSKRLTNMYLVLSELKDYVEINETGFQKVLKKYEKVVGAKLKSEYLEKVENEYPFLATTKAQISDAIERLVQWYARVAADGKIQLAQTSLKSHLREHIVWERNTIWRDMVEQERKRETIGFVPNIADTEAPRVVTIQICGCPCVIPTVIPTPVIAILVALAVLVTFTQLSIFPKPEQNNCLAILLFASILWAFEALPLFITSICVPFLVIVLRVMTKDGVRMDSKQTAKQIFSDMFGPVIMLLLGGFSLAAALSKHNIAKTMASFILGRAGTKPHAVLLANMFVSTFASMWISNVAAPVLCFSLIQPILRNLPHKSNYARCLVIGIAMAANVGGMASPIASPQNVVSMGIMDPPPSWGEWFAIALPLCIVLDLVIWGFLLMIYRPTEMNATPPELFSHMAETNFNGKQIYIILVSFLTIGLWCFESAIDDIVGDMGTIAVIPIVAFFGAGILTKDDWNSMLWSVVMLAMGGIALGKAVQSSGLLQEISVYLTPLLQDLSPFYCTALLAGIVVVITSFISHTVGALILLPVIAQIGLLLPDPRPRTLVMAAALMCSGVCKLFKLCYMAKKKKPVSTRGYATTSQVKKPEPKIKDEIEIKEQEVPVDVDEPINTMSLEQEPFVFNPMSKQLAKSITKPLSNTTIITLTDAQEAKLVQLKSHFKLKLSTAEEMELTYLKLMEYLPVEMVELALETAGGKFEDVVQWICLNFDIKDLPQRWTDKQVVVHEDAVVEKCEPIDFEQINQYQKVQAESKESMEDFNKQWILNNYESDDENEKASIPEDNSSDLLSEYIVLKKLHFKLKKDNNKAELKALGKQIAQTVKQMKQLNIDIPHDSQIVEMSAEETDYPPENSGGSNIDDQEDELAMNWFENVEGSSSVSKPLKLNLEIKNWTGKTPDQILQDYCKENIKYSNLKDARGFYCEINVRKSKICDEYRHSSKQQARFYIATKALYQLATEAGVYKLLPPDYLELWNSWKKEELDFIQGAEADIDRRRYGFISNVIANRTKLANDDATVESETSLFNDSPTYFDYKNFKNVKIDQDILNTTSTLPINLYKENILASLEVGNILLLSGETGSGKSTQTPQILLKDAISKAGRFNLICTQPRRISAVSLANRVAKEIGIGKVGEYVGYQVRNDSKTSSKTCITFCTTGVLLKRMVGCPNLNGVTHILVDEVHERTLDIDFILYLLKDLSQKSNIKIVLMSATADMEKFSQYFGTGNILKVPGKVFPVDTYYLEEILPMTGYILDKDSQFANRNPRNIKYKGAVNVSGKGGNKFKINFQVDESDSSDEETVGKSISRMDHRKINFELLTELILYIHENEDEGAILVFLPGLYEITTMESFIKQLDSDLEVFILHSNIDVGEQTKVFLPVTSGRKLVLSTNIAETGVTIPDIVYVIDTMKARESSFDSKKGLKLLKNVFISKANADQRKGRAGRITSGKCFRLIARNQYEKLVDSRPCEILRLPLNDILLQAKIICNQPLRDIFSSMIDSPPLKNVTSGISMLNTFEALDQYENVTKLGKFYSSLPMDLKLSRILLYGILFGCLDPILTIVSILSSGKSPVKTMPMKLNDMASDFFVSELAYNEWKDKRLNIFSLNSLNVFNLNLINSIRQNVSSSLKATLGPQLMSDPSMNRNSRNKDLLSLIIGTSLFPNVLKYQKELQIIRLKDLPVISKSFVTVGPGIYASNSIQIKSQLDGKQTATVFDLTKVPAQCLILGATSIKYYVKLANLA